MPTPRRSGEGIAGGRGFSNQTILSGPSPSGTAMSRSASAPSVVNSTAGAATSVFRHVGHWYQTSFSLGLPPITKSGKPSPSMSPAILQSPALAASTIVRSNCHDSPAAPSGVSRARAAMPNRAARHAIHLPASGIRQILWLPEIAVAFNSADGTLKYVRRFVPEASA